MAVYRSKPGKRLVIYLSLRPLLRPSDQVVKCFLDMTDYGRYYCFRALVEGDNYIYHAYLVVDGRPELMIEQDFNALNERVLRAETLQTIINWQIAGPLSENKCSSATFEVAAEQGALQESNEITHQ